MAQGEEKIDLRKRSTHSFSSFYPPSLRFVFGRSPTRSTSISSAGTRFPAVQPPRESNFRGKSPSEALEVYKESAEVQKYEEIGVDLPIHPQKLTEIKRVEREERDRKDWAECKSRIGIIGVSGFCAILVAVVILGSYFGTNNNNDEEEAENDFSSKLEQQCSDARDVLFGLNLGVADEDQFFVCFSETESFFCDRFNSGIRTCNANEICGCKKNKVFQLNQPGQGCIRADDFDDDDDCEEL